MASSVTDGWIGIAAEGDPDAARLVPDGVRDGSWCRSRNIPHLGCRPTARARGCRHTSAHPQVEAVTPGSSVVADELHVRVRTLRAAAHDGRLAATFGPRPYFGKVTARATREAGARFMATWYRRTYGRGRRRLVAVCRVTVPANYGRWCTNRNWHATVPTTGASSTDGVRVGRPMSVIVFNMLHPSSASTVRPPGVLARRPSPMIDLYLRHAFSTLAC